MKYINVFKIQIKSRKYDIKLIGSVSFYFILFCFILNAILVLAQLHYI